MQTITAPTTTPSPPLIREQGEDRHIVTRMAVKVYPRVLIESLPGKWRGYRVNPKHRLCYKIDTTGKQLGKKTAKGSGRIVLRSAYPWEVGDLTRIRIMKAHHVFPNGETETYEYLGLDSVDWEDSQPSEEETPKLSWNTVTRPISDYTSGRIAVEDFAMWSRRVHAFEGQQRLYTMGVATITTSKHAYLASIAQSENELLFVN